MNKKLPSWFLLFRMGFCMSVAFIASPITRYFSEKTWNAWRSFMRNLSGVEEMNKLR